MAAMIRALIFDFDGMILDTESTIYQSWVEVYQAYNCKLSLEEWVKNIGTSEEPFDPLRELKKQLGRPLDGQAIDQARRQREMELVMNLPVLDGVEDYLKGARGLGLKLGLASSSRGGWVVNHLTRLGILDLFDAINTGDDVPHTKPDPTLYVMNLAQLGVKSDEAVAFEDSPNGILAAKRAGLYCVVVPNSMTRSLPVDHADLLLNSLADLPLEELLLRIAASRSAS